MDETLCLGFLFIIFIIIPGIIWIKSVVFEGNRNGANCEPASEDNIIRSDTPNHPEYATQEAARLTNQRISGHNLGSDKHVYVSTEQADFHSQNSHIQWMLENGRAEKHGIHVHIVSPEERDKISAIQGNTSNTWHNTAPENSITTTVKPSGNTCVILALIFFVLFILAGLGILAIGGLL